MYRMYDIYIYICIYIYIYTSGYSESQRGKVSMAQPLSPYCTTAPLATLPLALPAATT